MKIQLNEVEGFAIISALMGMAMFGVGVLWDELCGITIHHSEGFGVLQILWCAGWGLYSIGAWYMINRWKE